MTIKTLQDDGSRPLSEQKESRALCGICKYAPSPLEAQEKLLASQEKSIKVCSCKLGHYALELDTSTPNCVRVIHTYQLHQQPQCSEGAISA